MSRNEQRRRTEDHARRLQELQKQARTAPQSYGELIKTASSNSATAGSRPQAQGPAKKLTVAEQRRRAEQILLDRQKQKVEAEKERIRQREEALRAQAEAQAARQREIEQRKAKKSATPLAPPPKPPAPVPRRAPPPPSFDELMSIATGKKVPPVNSSSTGSRTHAQPEPKKLTTADQRKRAEQVMMARQQQKVGSSAVKDRPRPREGIRPEAPPPARQRELIREPQKFLTKPAPTPAPSRPPVATHRRPAEDHARRPQVQRQPAQQPAQSYRQPIKSASTLPPEPNRSAINKKSSQPSAESSRSKEPKLSATAKRKLMEKEIEERRRAQIKAEKERIRLRNMALSGRRPAAEVNAGPVREPVEALRKLVTQKKPSVISQTVTQTIRKGSSTNHVDKKVPAAPTYSQRPDHSQRDHHRESKIQQFHRERLEAAKRARHERDRSKYDPLDSSEDEEDEEMREFIDDGQDELQEDISTYIREIFGYDKRKYMDDSDEDLRNMEASFGEIDREELQSAKLGLLEDLKDMREEAAHKKMKMERKKRGRVIESDSD